jgi:HNH endonuclease
VIGLFSRMPRGPAHFKSKGACIYCGMTDVKLTDEHIVPYSLGGSHVLRDASCVRCANITKKFEQRVARDLWGDARISFNAPTRRKRERKSHIVMPDPHDQTKNLTVPAKRAPGWARVLRLENSLTVAGGNCYQTAVHMGLLLSGLLPVPATPEA